MFDDVIRELKRFERGVTVSVPIEADEEGYLDKECPSDTCLSAFKIHAEDWTNLVSDELAYCPICRHGADAQQWFTTEQVEHAKQVALSQFHRQFDQAMRRGARRAARERLSNSSADA